MKKITLVRVYQIFLVALLLSQVYPLFFQELDIYERISHYVVSVYILFRLYMFSVLNTKALSMGLTLSEFFNKRDKFMND